MSLIDVIFKKNALPKVPASLKELVGEIKGIKTAIADLWRSMTNAEGNINRLDEAVEADENTLGDIVKHKVYLTGSTLNQAMISKENTIYVVKDDLTLSENVTVPENCVMEFEGGSIGGAHTLTGQNTSINAGLVKIFSTDVTLAGSWNVAKWMVEWFGVKANNSQNQSSIINKIIENTNIQMLVFSKGVYNANIKVYRSNITIVGHGKETILKSFGTDNVFEVGDVENPYVQPMHLTNIQIKDLAIDGNYQNITPPSSDLRGHGIIATDSSKCLFENLYIHGCTMTGLDIVIGSNYNIVRDIFIEDIHSALTYPAFDVNSSKYNVIEGVIIKDAVGFRLLDNCEGNIVENLIVDGGGIRINAGEGNIIKDNRVSGVVVNAINPFLLGENTSHVNTTIDNIVELTILKSKERNSQYGVVTINKTAENNNVKVVSSDNSKFPLYVRGNNNKIEIYSNGDGTAYSDSDAVASIFIEGSNNVITGKIETSTLRAITFIGDADYNEINVCLKINTASYNGTILHNVIVDENIPKRLPSDNRPVLNSRLVGQQSFDITSKKPIWWNGTAWVDATGATV